MYPQLLGLQAARKLSNEEMAKLIGKTRQSLDYKMQTGNFTVSEVKTLCNYFGKPFDYLFATEEEIGTHV